MMNFIVNVIILFVASLSGVNCSLFNHTSKKSVVTYSFDQSQIGILFALSLDLMATNITADGVLFYVSNRPENDDFILLYMKKSNLHLKYKCGTNSDVLTLPVVNQFEWHTAKVFIKTSDVSLLLNDEIQKRNHGCKSITLKSPYYIAGADDTISSEDIENNTDEGITKTAFVGCLKNFKPIGQPTETRTSNVIPCSGKVEEGTYFSGAGHVRMFEKFEVGKHMNIQMQIKPRNLSGLIMAVHGEMDFLILQMVNGSIKFTVNNGYGPFTATYTPISQYYFLDNQFHTITALKFLNVNHLQVDANEPIIGVDQNGFRGDPSATTDHPLYVGGYPPTSTALQGIKSGANFKGCIKNLDINNKLEDLSSYTAFGDVMFNVCPTI